MVHGLIGHVVLSYGLWFMGHRVVVMGHEVGVIGQRLWGRDHGFKRRKYKKGKHLHKYVLSDFVTS
jgi:hypothetical protein